MLSHAFVVVVAVVELEELIAQPTRDDVSDYPSSLFVWFNILKVEEAEGR